EHPRVARGVGSDFVGRAVERAGNRTQDVRQESGLVAPRARLRTQVSRREVGRIGLDQQAVARNLAHELQQVPAAPLVADPAGNPYIEPEVQVRAQLVLLAGEAMRDRGRQSTAARSQHFGEARVRVTRMQEERLAELARKIELSLEP